MLSNYEFAERERLMQLSQRTPEEQRRMEQLCHKYSDECDKDDEESHRSRRDA